MVVFQKYLTYSAATHTNIYIWYEMMAKVFLFGIQNSNTEQQQQQQKQCKKNGFVVYTGAFNEFLILFFEKKKYIILISFCLARTKKDCISF